MNNNVNLNNNALLISSSVDGNFDNNIINDLQQNTNNNNNNLQINENNNNLTLPLKVNLIK